MSRVAHVARVYLFCWGGAGSAVQPEDRKCGVREDLNNSNSTNNSNSYINCNNCRHFVVFFTTAAEGAPSTNSACMRRRRWALPGAARASGTAWAITLNSRQYRLDASQLNEGSRTAAIISTNICQCKIPESRDRCDSHCSLAHMRQGTSNPI